MGTHIGGTGPGPAMGSTGPGGRCPERPATGHPSPARTGAPLTRPDTAAGIPAFALPPLSLARSVDPVADLPVIPEAPAWSPLRVALPLFAVVWACFAALAAAVTAPPAADVARLAHLLATGAAVVVLVLITLSVAHTQVSGLSPSPMVVAVVVLGALQALAATAVGSGGSDLWRVGAQVFLLIGAAVPLAWVGGQFQCGVRRRRVEEHASLLASWIERARRQAQGTVDSVHRHDVRSMLFVIDGAARALIDSDPNMSDEQRTAFAGILTDSIERLGSLMDVRSQESQPFAADGVARAVVHAERKAGRTISSTVPGGLRSAGRAADVAAVLRTLVAVTDRGSTSGVQLRGQPADGAVVVYVEPAGSAELPLLSGNWEEVWVEMFKVPSSGDEGSIDLFVSARLLADQGADLWSTAGRDRFALRLPAAPASEAKDGV